MLPQCVPCWRKLPQREPETTPILSVNPLLDTLLGLAGVAQGRLLAALVPSVPIRGAWSPRLPRTQSLARTLWPAACLPVLESSEAHAVTDGTAPMRPE